MEYRFGPHAPLSAVGGGTNILILGPAMTGKRAIVEEMFFGGDPDESRLLVTTRKPAANTRKALQPDYAAYLDTLRLIDCTAGDGDRVADEPDWANNPNDLTGLGITISNWVEDGSAGANCPRRMLFESTSTFKMYHEEATLFRFLHILTGRLAQVGALGLFVSNATTISEEGALPQLFDLIIQFREGAEGLECRVDGTDRASSEWVSAEQVHAVI